jgi:hypothetical protein
MRGYGYVIVGAGSAGRVVARRLLDGPMRQTSCSRQVGRTKASTAFRIRPSGARTSVRGTTGPTATKQVRTCSTARSACRWERFSADRAASTACCGLAVTGRLRRLGAHAGEDVTNTDVRTPLEVTARPLHHPGEPVAGRPRHPRARGRIPPISGYGAQLRRGGSRRATLSSTLTVTHVSYPPGGR